LKVPETDPLFQSEDAREALKQILGQPLKMFDTGLSSSTPVARTVFPGDVNTRAAWRNALRFRLQVPWHQSHMSVASSPPGEDSRERQADVSKSEQAELPMAMRPPADASIAQSARPIVFWRNWRHLLEAGAFTSASAPDIVEEGWHNRWICPA